MVRFAEEPRAIMRAVPRVFFVLAAFLGALAVRISPYRERIIASWGTIVTNEDAWYHFRRAFFTVRHFPHPPVLDHYIGYPYGTHYFKPPLWEMVIATPAWLMYGSRVTRDAFMAYAVYVPPVIGALTVIVIYLIARELYDEPTAVMSALFGIVATPLVRLSVIGDLDRHVFDCLLIAVIALFVIKALKGEWRWSLAAGATLGLLALSYPGSSLTMGLLGIFLYIHAATVRDGLSRRKALLIAAAAFATALVLLLALAPSGLISATLSFERLSALHLALLAGVAALAGGLYLIDGKAGEALSRRLAYAFAAAALLLAALVAPLRQELIRGLMLTFGRYPLAYSIAEERPLFFPVSGFSLERMLSVYSWSFVLLLPAAYGICIEACRKAGRKPEHIFFFSWLAASLFLGIAVIYNHLFLAVPMAVALGRMTGALGRIPFMQKVRPAALVYLPMLAVAALPLWAFISLNSEAAPVSLNNNRYLSFQRVAAETERQDSMQPSRPAPYTIMAPWTYGNYLVNISGRAVVASNNLERAGNFGGLVASQRFFQTADEEVAYSIARRVKARYVFVGNRFAYCFGDIERSWPAPGGEQPVYRAVGEAIGADPQLVGSMYYRMFYSNGEADPMTHRPALRHFRLVYEERSLTDIAFKLYRVER